MPRHDFPVERAAFARLRASLLPQHEGVFVVLFGNELVAVSPTLPAALVAGFARASGPKFFVARLSAHGDMGRVPAEILWTAAEA